MPHQATWLSWPHNRASWPGRFEQAEASYATMVSLISQREPVHMNVADAAMEQRAAALLRQASASGDVTFHHFPTNDAWCRDHGGIIVKRIEEDQFAPSRVIIDWGYNAWGGKYPPFDLDDQIPKQMARYLELPRIAGGMILEGGSIEVNGEGVLMTTESCLLNPNRNPHLSQSQIEAKLKTMLGVAEVMWLGDGIEGDDTDGHVDDLTRFVKPWTVVTVLENNRADSNYVPLQENFERLRGWRSEAGHAVEIACLPMPEPIYLDDQRLPASYANFYIGNHAVYVPQFRQPTDAVATGILADLMPDREIVPVDCYDLIVGLGAVHCLTQQIPS